MSGVFNAAQTAIVLETLSLKDINHENIIQRFDSLKMALLASRSISFAFSQESFEMVGYQCLKFTDEVTDWQEYTVLLIAYLLLPENAAKSLTPIINNLKNSLLSRLRRSDKDLGLKLTQLIIKLIHIVEQSTLIPNHYYTYCLGHARYFKFPTDAEIKKLPCFLKSTKVFLWGVANTLSFFHLGLLATLKKSQKAADYFFELGARKDVCVQHLFRAYQDVAKMLSLHEDDAGKALIMSALAERVSIYFGFLTPKKNKSNNIQVGYFDFKYAQDLLVLLSEYYIATDQLATLDDPLLVMMFVATLSADLPSHTLIDAELARRLVAITPRLQQAINVSMVRLFLIANDSPHCVHITNLAHLASAGSKEASNWPSFERSVAYQRTHLKLFGSNEVDESKRTNLRTKHGSTDGCVAARGLLSTPFASLKKLYLSGGFDFNLMAVGNFSRFQNWGGVATNSMSSFISYCRSEMTAILIKLRKCEGSQTGNDNHQKIVGFLLRLYRICSILDLIKNNKEAVKARVSTTEIPLKLTQLKDVLAELKAFRERVKKASLVKEAADFEFVSSGLKVNLSLKACQPHLLRFDISPEPIEVEASESEPGEVSTVMTKKRRVAAIEHEAVTDGVIKSNQAILQEGYDQNLKKCRVVPLSYSSDQAMIQRSIICSHVPLLAHKLCTVLSRSPKEYHLFIDGLKALISHASDLRNEVYFRRILKDDYQIVPPASSIDALKKSLLFQFTDSIFHLPLLSDEIDSLHKSLISTLKPDESYMKKLRELCQICVKAKALNVQYSGESLEKFKRTADGHQWAVAVNSTLEVTSRLKETGATLKLLVGSAPYFGV